MAGAIAEVRRNIGDNVTSFAAGVGGMGRGLRHAAEQAARQAVAGLMQDVQGAVGRQLLPGLAVRAGGDGGGSSCVEVQTVQS